jgi:hypothetical protein
MQLLALCHKTISCQWVRILAAQQRPNLPATVCINYLQASTITIGPNKLLIERGHKLALVIKDLSFITDQYC